MSRTRLVLATTAAAVLLVAVGSAGAAAFPFGGDGASGPPAAPAATASAAKPAPAGDGEILKVGGDVKEPVPLTSVPPAYPEEARKNRVQGKVLLEAVVDEKGIVAKVGTLESPDPALADAAVEAVKRWTYKPATLKGKPVKVRMTITVNFKLS